MDEIELEVFRADTRASRGISAADIAAVAEFDCAANPIPVVIGHPKSDTPAEGSVKAFRAEGNKLFATLAGLTSDLVDKVRNGSLLNRSMAFFGGDHEANPTPGKLAPRHLGFLGGSAPGIPGMAPLKTAFQFDAEGEGFTAIGDPAEAIVFEAPATAVRRVQEEPQGMTEAEIQAEKDRLAAERTAFEAEQATFAASRATARTSANKTRVSALVTAGKVLPADAPALEMVFGALSDGELEFAAGDKGDPADKLVAILSKGPAMVDASGRPISPKGERSTFAATGNVAKDSASITAAARELMSKDKGLSFEAAVELVTETEEG